MRRSWKSSAYALACREHETPRCPTSDRMIGAAPELTYERQGPRDGHQGGQAMSPVSTFATVDAWLAWFATSKQAACRAYLCARYHLNALDAEALINDAQLQVYLHWATLKHPPAYLWQTLTHAVRKQAQHHSREQRQLAVYAQQHRLHAHGAVRMAEHIAAVLAQASPRQRRLLAWYAQGHGDTQVAVWLTTTPQAVRVARHGAYRALRTQLRLPERGTGRF
jgi:DNA-binding CsgD family transcriptional regulator